MKGLKGSTNTDMDREIPKQTLLRERRKLLLKIAIVTTVVVVIIILLLNLFAQGIRADTLQFSTVERGPIELTINTSGIVHPAVEEAVVSPISSRLLQVFHKQGDSVTAGTPLLQLDLLSTQSSYEKMKDQLQMRILEGEQREAQNASDLSNMQMNLKVMDMQIDQKRIELKNALRLDSLGGGTANTTRQVEMSLKVAELEREQLKLKMANEQRIARAQRNVKELEVQIAAKNLNEVGKVLDEAKLKAPRTGILTFINTQVGAQISAGMQVATVSDLSHFRIEGEFPDGYANRVSTGTPVLIKAGSQRLNGQVTLIAPTSKNGTLNCSIQITDSVVTGLRSGLKVELYLQTAKKHDVLRIGHAAFYKKAGPYQVWVRNGNEIVQRKVTLGEASYEYIEVVNGLREGDVVVLSDMAAHKDHLKLKLR